MSQVILVGSYRGLSDYTFEVEVTGRPLSLSEVEQMGLVDDPALNLHSFSDYTQEWFEIGPGDRITIRAGEIGEVETLTFLIPATPLVGLPQRLEHTLMVGLRDYLLANCPKAA